MRERMFQTTALLVLVISLMLAPVTAQVVTVEISGDVSDASGAMIVGATVIAKNLDTSAERRVVTDARGHYTLLNMPVGAYSIRAEHTGFQPIVHQRVALSLGQNPVINFSMKPASTSDAITVSGEVALLDQATAQVGQTIRTTSIENMPINGRDYSQIAALAPGVHMQGTSTTTIYMGGQSYTNSSFKVDGMDNDSEYVAGRQMKYNMDAIGEVQVLTGQFLPEFGRSGAGVVNVITRSGTNDLHGSAFYYGREDALDSKNAFAATKPPFDRKQYGGTVGGPIKKDKTFFFASIERLQADNSAFIVTPTLNESFPQPIRETTVFGKINQQLSQNHTLQFIYNFDNYYQGGQGVGGTSLPSHSFHRAYTNNNFIAGDTYVFGPRALNDFRFQYQRHNGGNSPDTPGQPEIDRPSTISGTPTSTPAIWDENKSSFSEAFTRNFTAAGEHTLKVGAQIQLVRGNTVVSQYPNGRFTFSTDAAFNPAVASTYPTQYDFTSGNPVASLDNAIYSFHINDEWRPTSRLTFNLGLRYDNEHGPLVNLFPSANANLAPRVSFAWSPTGSRDWVVRGGYGRFYYRMYGNLGTNLIIAGAPAPYGDACCNIITIFNPGYPDPYGANPNNSSVAIPLKTGAFSCVTLGNPAIRPSCGNSSSPYADDLSVGVGKQFSSGLSVNIDFLRNKGNNLARPFDQNAPNPTTGIRPIAGYAELYTYDNSGESWYNALMVKAEKRFSHGSTFLISYTNSSNQDTMWPLFATQAAAGPQSWSNPSAEKAYAAGSGGNSDYYEPNRGTVSGLQQLPWGFQFSGIFTYFSPLRFNITTGRDNNGDGVLSDRPNFSTVAAGGSCAGVLVNGGCYVDPGTGPAVAGNLPRNAGVFSRGFASLDLRLAKSFKFKERYSIQLMMEAFNIMNRTNYSSYTGNIRSALFDRPTAAYDPRQLQFGAKFNF
jgi:hypothetical protein